jgi:myo-inositol-1(or 4)-monophosphatase
VKHEEIARRHRECCRIATEAGALAKQYFEDASSLAVESKGVQDYVSVADRTVEGLIRDRIASLFPGDRCFGEESGGDTSVEEGCGLWVIDPIDGTHNFLRGYPHYGVSIACMIDGRVEVGAVHDPSMGQLFAAKRGAGATLNGEPMRVSRQDRLDQAILCVGFSHSSPLPNFFERFSRVIERRCEFRRIGSAALGLAHVAAGHFDAFWQMHLHSWDVLAGLLLVEEAGGRMNRFLVPRALEDGNETLGSNPPLFDELRQLLEIR